jgi:hypothetical protein
LAASRGFAGRGARPFSRRTGVFVVGGEHKFAIVRCTLRFDIVSTLGDTTAALCLSRRSTGTRRVGLGGLFSTRRGGTAVHGLLTDCDDVLGDSTSRGYLAAISGYSQRLAMLCSRHALYGGRVK